jgi:hypothetical protein
MAVAPLLISADAEQALHNVNPWWVGLSIMVLLILLMLGLLAFGAGRDHS